MKKVLIVLLLMFGALNLASCDNLPGGSNNSGNLGDGTTVVFKDGTKILLNDSTDGVEVYNTIIKNYVEGTTYDLSAKIYKIGDTLYDQTINGIYYYKKTANIDYLETINNELELKVHYYSLNSDEMIYLAKYQDAPLYGGGSINREIINLEYNGEVLPLMYPPVSDINDPKTEADCKYLTIVHRMRSVLSLGVLSGFYFNFYFNEIDIKEEFKYSFSINDQYLIFSVEQPIGEIYSYPVSSDPALIRRGIVTKEIHFNMNTCEIDYVKANVQTYSYPEFYGLLYQYSYELTKVNSISIDQKIADLKEYIYSYSVN